MIDIILNVLQWSSLFHVIFLYSCSVLLSRLKVTFDFLERDDDFWSWILYYKWGFYRRSLLCLCRILCLFNIFYIDCISSSIWLISLTTLKFISSLNLSLTFFLSLLSAAAILNYELTNPRTFSFEFNLWNLFSYW